MRKQTKLVAVLSAAALLALGASMTSFAAGWEKDEEGIWHYYDSSDEMVTDEWKKDGGKWFYLNEDGDMLTDAWVDDDHYVGEDGALCWLTSGSNPTVIMISTIQKMMRNPGITLVPKEKKLPMI